MERLIIVPRHEPAGAARGPRRAHEDGFTLIELMVVVLVIGILMAIALPSFFGARKRAADRAAQATLRTAYTAAQVAYIRDSDYTGAIAADLPSEESSILYLAGNVPSTTGPRAVSVGIASAVGSMQVWGAAQLSDSHTCFYLTSIMQGPNQGLYKNSVDVSGGGDCLGDDAAALTTSDGSW